MYVAFVQWNASRDIYECCDDFPNRLLLDVFSVQQLSNTQHGNQAATNGDGQHNQTLWLHGGHFSARLQFTDSDGQAQYRASPVVCSTITTVNSLSDATAITSIIFGIANSLLHRMLQGLSKVRYFPAL
jgi:hypothetical protein